MRLINIFIMNEFIILIKYIKIGLCEWVMALDDFEKVLRKVKPM